MHKLRANALWQQNALFVVRVNWYKSALNVTWTFSLLSVNFKDSSFLAHLIGQMLCDQHLRTIKTWWARNRCSAGKFKRRVYILSYYELTAT